MPLRAFVRLLAALTACALAAPVVAEPRFDNYEIRVIRPRFATKTGHLELAAGLATIVNQTFIYTVLATGLLSYHFSEILAVEAEAGYGWAIDRDDKRILNDDFGIKTILLRPQWIGNARLVWTPSYGKFNVSASRIVYFDTDLTLGAGETGMRYTYDYCDDGTAPPAATRAYPTLVGGLSQRYFLDTRSSLRIGIEDQRVLVNTADAACDPATAVSGTASHDDLLLYVAWSYYL
jgi:outer membrane beta-barrel protein